MKKIIMYSQNKEGKILKSCSSIPLFSLWKSNEHDFISICCGFTKCEDLSDRTKMEQSLIYLTEQKWNSPQSIWKNKNGTVPNLLDRTKMEQSPIYRTEQKWNSPQSFGQNKNGTVPNLSDRTTMEQSPIYWTEQKWNSPQSYNINKYNLDIHTCTLKSFYIKLIIIRVFWYAQLIIVGPTMHQNISMTMAVMGHEYFLSLSLNKSFHAIFTILQNFKNELFMFY